MPDSVDSNVLIYLTLNDPEKGPRADRLLYDGGVVGIQVLNEIANVLRRKARRDWGLIAEFLEAVEAKAEIRPLTLAVHRDGLRLARRYNFSVYDAMIVAAALDAGCAILWSEDMHDGLVIDGQLTIRNPFGDVAPVA